MDRDADGIPGLRSRYVRQFKHGLWRDLEDVIAPEEVLRLHWPECPPKELLAYPDGGSAWLRLALGHALLEFCKPGELPALLQHEGANYHLAPVQTPEGQTEDSPARGFPPLSGQELLQRMGEFIQAAGKWEHTGCFHRMALYAPLEGRFVAQVEDIGRHNCVDRLAGYCLERNLAPGNLALFASARATGSLAVKAVRAGFALMISRSAVTTAGLQRAEEGGLTLLGFAREIRFTVFADPKGLVLDTGEHHEGLE